MMKQPKLLSRSGLASQRESESRRRRSTSQPPLPCNCCHHSTPFAMSFSRPATSALRAASLRSVAPRSIRGYAAAASQDTRPPVALYGVDGTYASALVCSQLSNSSRSSSGSTPISLSNALTQVMSSTPQPPSLPPSSLSQRPYRASTRSSRRMLSSAPSSMRHH